MSNWPPVLVRQVETHPFPLLFATISGAHLYGFPSADSDYDLRGVHLLPAKNLLGLDPGEETVEKSGVIDGIEVDLVSHDARKFFLLLLRKNGYVLEQLYSPLIMHTTKEHEELKQIARGCVTRHHAHHYFGFGETQWKLLEKQSPRHVKPLLYVYRVLLTGIWLMKSGEIEANLVKLNEYFKLAHVSDLIALKVGGAEQTALSSDDFEFHRAEYERLRGELQTAFENSSLPELPSAKGALNDLLLRVRVK